MSKTKPNSKKSKNASRDFWYQITNYPLSFAVFFILVFVVYQQILGFFPGKFDENLIILDNLPFLTDFGNLKEAFFRDAFFSINGVDFYRPLQNLSLMLDANLSGPMGWGYYLSNMLIHASTVCSLYYLLNLLNENKKINFSVSLLFLANPLFVQAIAWAPSRGDLLIGLFGVLSFIFFVKYRNDKKPKDLAFNVLFFLLAVLSKETAMIIPLTFLAFYLTSDKEKRVSLKDMLVPVVSYVLVAVFYFYLRSIVVHKLPSGNEFGLMPFLNNIRTLPEFIGKFFIPVHLAPMAGFTLLNTFIGIALIVLLIIGIMKFRQSRKIYLFGSLWFVLFALPGLLYSHELGGSAYDYLEHRAYLPMLGMMIILGSLMNEISKVRKISTIPVILICLSLIYGLYSYVYSKNYENPLTFYNLAVEANPNSAMAVNNRGLVKNEIKDTQGAISDYQEAIKLKPDYAQVYVNLGILKSSLGDKNAALKDYETALKLKPGLFQARFNTANIKLDLGKLQDALIDYEAAMKLNPNYSPGYLTMGSVKSQLGNNSGALKDFGKAILLNKNNPEAFLNRGKVKYLLKDSPGACSDWKSAVALGNKEAEQLIIQYCK